MLLLDRVPIFDANKFMIFDPLHIQRVAVFTKRYVYGRQDNPSLLSFTTYQGNSHDFPRCSIGILPFVRLIICQIWYCDIPN